VAKKLYVGNLPFSATEDELRNVFAGYNVVSAKVISDRETGRSRGFAFVEVESAEQAISEMNGKDMGGRKLIVNEAKERESRGPRTGGGYQGGNSGGYQGGGNYSTGGDYDRQGGGRDRGYNRRDAY
jgi:RNA recognition motif-containing protein